MLKFCGQRGNGKTKELLKYALENNFYILSLDDVKIRDYYISIGGNPNKVIQFSEDNLKSLVDKSLDFVIDDIDVVINYLTRGCIRGISLTTID